MRSGVDTRRGYEADTDLETALGAARAGAEWGFVALYRDLQPRLLRYLRVLGCADADDVASETWLQVVRDLRAGGATLQAIAGELNRQGHTTRRGKPWNATQVARVLARAIDTGINGQSRLCENAA